MPQASLQPQNEAVYEELITLIETIQGRLAPIIVACDDRTLRERIIQRYEAEARQAKIRSYRIELGKEPSVRAGLAGLKDADPYLQQGGAAVFTVTGAELLLRVHLRSEDTGQTQLDKFFGYLQWTREGLREFPYPIVLWVTHRILKEMSRRAPDFWSWRKAVLRFAEENSAITVPVTSPEPLPRQIEPEPDEEFLPPLEDLQDQIAQLEAKSPESSSLATLYDRLGQVYAKRVRQGKATDLAQERQLAINAFQTAISRYQILGNKSAQINSLIRLGNFLDSQSRFSDAVTCHQQSLELALEIGDRNSEANSLNNLGNVYCSIGQHQRAINFYQQSMKISREISNLPDEAISLNNLGYVYYLLGHNQKAIDVIQQSLKIKLQINNSFGAARSLNDLGNVYQSLGQYHQAIDFFQQSLEIKRKISDLEGEAHSLTNLGNTYQVLEQYHQAIDFFQQSLEIERKIGDRDGEAGSLFNMGKALAKLDRRWEAKQSYQQALAICKQLGLDYRMERCKTAIYELQQIVSPAPVRAPSIRDEPPLQRPRRRRTFFSRLRQFLSWLWQKMVRRIKDRG